MTEIEAAKMILKQNGDLMKNWLAENKDDKTESQKAEIAYLEESENDPEGFNERNGYNKGDKMSIYEKEGYKNDSGKIQYSQIPPECLEALADVLTHGAKEYSDDNWTRLPNPNKRYYDALMRHIHAWRKGEKMDESGKTHLQCAMANAMFLLWFEIKETEKC